MGAKNVTLRVNSETYEHYRNYCKKEGLLVSRQFEIMMEKQMKSKKIASKE